MCVVVRYASMTGRRVVTTFLGLVSLESGTAAAITAALPAFLEEQKLNPTKCVGPATDGCYGWRTQLGGDQIQGGEAGLRPHSVRVTCVTPFSSAHRTR